MCFRCCSGVLFLPSLPLPSLLLSFPFHCFLICLSFPFSFPLILWFCLKKFNSLYIYVSLVNNRAVLIYAVIQVNPTSNLIFSPLIITCSRCCGNHINGPTSLSILESHPLPCDFVVSFPIEALPSIFESGFGCVICFGRLNEGMCQNSGPVPSPCLRRP